MSIRSDLNSPIEPLSELLHPAPRMESHADPVVRKSAARDPAPQYPRWVVFGCVVLTIVLFVLGFLRG